MTETTLKASDRKQWFIWPKRNPQASVRLFCFPYAGGGIHIYREWPMKLPNFVDVSIAQLPGRSHRLNETPFTNLARLVEAIMPEILPHLDRPFALFGHSMGAKICFELARQLETIHGLQPYHLFVSGCRAPHRKSTESPSYNLPEPEFIETLKSLNGTPKEVLENAELMQLLIPLLRADFEVVQTYSYLPGPPLACPVTSIGGLQDTDVSREALQDWRIHTKSLFTLRLLPGDHFFINSARSELLSILARTLYQSVAVSGR